MSTAQLTDQPVGGLSHHLTDHMNTLPQQCSNGSCFFPENGAVFARFTFFLRESLCPLSRHVSQWFKLTLNHVLEANTGYALCVACVEPLVGAFAALSDINQPSLFPGSHVVVISSVERKIVCKAERAAIGEGTAWIKETCS
jgi:hypothetical protein